jgi:GAF domain-containing protein
MSVPLLVRGEHRGVLIAATAGPAGTDAEMQIMAALAGQEMVALDNARRALQLAPHATQQGCQHAGGASVQVQSAA